MGKSKWCVSFLSCIFIQLRMKFLIFINMKKHVQTNETISYSKLQMSFVQDKLHAHVS